MKKALLLVAMAVFAGNAMAQSNHKLAPEITFLNPQKWDTTLTAPSLKSLGQFKPQPFDLKNYSNLNVLSPQMLASNQTRVSRSPVDHMPVVAFKGNSKMPVAGLNGKSRMPVSGPVNQLRPNMDSVVVIP